MEESTQKVLRMEEEWVSHGRNNGCLGIITCHDDPSKTSKPGLCSLICWDFQRIHEPLPEDVDAGTEPKPGLVAAETSETFGITNQTKHHS